MSTNSEKIFLVENDPEVSDLIARQALQPLGYQIQVVNDANSAILQAAKFAPDLVIADLTLKGLSGKDLLVAFSAQGIQIPIIVIAAKGQENNVIQAFRLGAADYLLWPAREAEVVASVERVLKQVRDARARQRLDQQLKETNQELQHRVRELTTIFAIGKAVISITDQRVLFDQIVDGMVSVAEADYGWLLLRDERSKLFYLAAHRNLPESWSKKMGRQLDDGISSLVALSGETLAINGEPLKRFKAAQLGQSAVVIPVKVQREVIGMLVIVRKADQVIERNAQALLEAVADYASISLVNARLFRALQEAVDSAKSGESRKHEQLQRMQNEIREQMEPMAYAINLLLGGEMGVLSQEQKQAIRNMQAGLLRILEQVSSEHPSPPTAASIKK